MDTFYVQSEAIEQRSDLLLNHAKDLLNSGVLPSDKVDLRDYRLKHIAEGYFLLNKAYKGWRISDGHRTEPPKIAALQCVTISRYQPFFPLHTPVDEADPALAKPNEIFAFSYALGILDVSFDANTPEKVDFWLRILDVISSCSAQTLEPYTTDINLAIYRDLSEYESTIKRVHPDDHPAINALISIFELMSDKRHKLLSPVSNTPSTASKLTD